MKISSNCLIKLKKKFFYLKLENLNFFFETWKITKIWTQAGVNIMMHLGVLVLETQDDMQLARSSPRLIVQRQVDIDQ